MGVEIAKVQLRIGIAHFKDKAFKNSLRVVLSELEEEENE